eukprot:CAMPEP_0204833982 /NCGR_PEP_ID=MMETSP1346-20131115/18457_1 /ASSEMBLY_ACC=CAM_ASM_000771 /TAXON_ID=215587 /ORGANISM="Aplanochytrium stocchinoi, Strain GSBS06" /LENGTH=870 /DNA_ID=CAMNT_0051966949 /DNA_START=402 /DNA_END=3011 /DNA_ORIENTATION=+
MPPDFTMVFALALVMAAQIVTTSEGLAGFSSSAVLSVAVLYVVAAGITATGALDHIMNKVLGTPTALVGAQLRLMLPVAVISAFMNNTPVVAIMIPIVQQWSKRVDIPPSQLFIPLSFASILGGTCTLIGTSTNLVVAGKAEETGIATIGLFDLTLVGVPVLFTGIIYIILFAPLLLPSAEDIEKRQLEALGVNENRRDGRAQSLRALIPKGIATDFTVRCLVQPDSEVCNQGVDQAGLRGLDGLYLTSVQRDGHVFNAVGPEFVINEYDILFFTGLVETFPEFCIKNSFTPITDDNEETLNDIMNGIGNQTTQNGVRKSPTKSPRVKWKSKSKAIKSDSSSGLQSSSSTSGADSDAFQNAKLEMWKLNDSPDHDDDSKECPSTIMGEIVPTKRMRKGTFDGRLMKVIVRSGGGLDGRTPKEVNFRRKYEAAVLSINRAGEKVGSRGGLGRIVLQAGDELMILTGDCFDWDNKDTENDLKLSTVDSNTNNQTDEQFGKEFLISMVVRDSSRLKGARPLAGQTIEAAGLRGLPGLFLIALEREDGTIFHAVGSDAILNKNDTLWFAGERSSVATLRRIPGLVSPNSDQVNKLKVNKLERRLVECVISMDSDLIGKTVRESRFRSRFRAAIIAVHRSGHRLLNKVGDIELRPGDVLILDTGPYFIPRFRDDRNFLLVAEIENSTPPRFDKFYIALLAVIGMMALYTAFQDKLSLFECAVFAAAVMVVFDIISPQRARSSISWEVIITIACAFGLSTAMENSNVAQTIGQALVDLAILTGTGEIGILFAVYLATFLLSIVIANNAAALLMFPIAVQAIEELGLEPEPTLFVLMLAASSSFASPFGYQTNLMVYGPGQYIFMDYVKFGLPMQFW